MCRRCCGAEAALAACNDVPVAVAGVAAEAVENCRLKITTAATIKNLMNFMI
jgi:hypothetical protein